MKRLILHILLITCSVSLLNGQSVTLKQVVLPTQGRSAKFSNNILSWTLGETFISTRTKSGIELTEGFQKSFDFFTMDSTGAVGVLSVDIDSTCKGNKVMLTLDSYNGSIRWQKKDTSNWMNILGLKNDTIFQSDLDLTQSYRAIVSKDKVHRDTSNIVKVFVYNEEIDVEYQATVDTLERGEIYLDPLYGTIPYRYRWSNDSVTRDLKNLEGGVYSVTIHDDHDCMIKVDSIVIDSTYLKNSILVSTHITDCTSKNKGGIVVESVHGVMQPYKIVWPNIVTLPDGFFSGLTDSFNLSINYSAFEEKFNRLNSRTSLPPGKYSFSISDSVLSKTVQFEVGERFYINRSSEVVLKGDSFYRNRFFIEPEMDSLIKIGDNGWVNGFVFGSKTAIDTQSLKIECNSINVQSDSGRLIIGFVEDNDTIPYLNDSMFLITNPELRFVGLYFEGNKVFARGFNGRLYKLGDYTVQDKFKIYKKNTTVLCYQNSRLIHKESVASSPVGKFRTAGSIYNKYSTINIQNIIYK